MQKLTATAIQARLRSPPGKRIDLMDGAVPGLMLRLGPGGATWSLRIRVVGEGGVSARGYQKKGNKSRVTLGTYPTLSIERARALANTYLDQANKGMSPVAALESAATSRGLTVRVLTERFIADYVRMKELRALLKYEGAIRVHIVPHLGTLLADAVTREHVRGLVRKTMVRVPRGSGARDRPRGGREAARTTLGVFRKMVNWVFGKSY